MKAFYIFVKDWKSEMRTRYAFNSQILFILITITIVSISVSTDISNAMTCGLYWLVIFFAAMSGLSRTFVTEEERGTILTLQLNASSTVIFSGKLLFNLFLLIISNIIITLSFALFLKLFIISNFLIFLLTFILGSIGIASTATIISAIISKTNTRGSLFTILSFPLVLPLIIVLIDLTNLLSENIQIHQVVNQLVILISYDVIVITASFLLFDFIWKD
ncbi:MAG: heme exporter protein CcmB [Ignavibacteriales bacterium]|nr:heme exporter protein CcmB [Ignavibacteriales bacterium]